MSRGRRFPIRFKILVALLVIITVVVGAITFAMARMFHSDKTLYVRDLTSIVSRNLAEETDGILNGYRERLRVFTRILYESRLPRNQRDHLLQDLFEEYQDLIAVSILEDGVRPVTIYDTDSLRQAGMRAADLQAYRRNNPIPMDQLRAGRIFIENVTQNDALPMAALSYLHRVPGTGKTAIIEAVVRLERLLKLVARSGAFESIVVDSRGNVLVHPDVRMVTERGKVDWLPETKDLLMQQGMNITREYAAHGGPVIGGITRVVNGSLLAVTQLPRSAAYLTARELLVSLVLTALALLIVATVLSLFLARRITRPIDRLSAATTRIAQGDFSVKVERSSEDEVGDLADSFTHMASELDDRERRLKETQAALVQSEKMAAFGQLGAGIAHEVKNPLAGILGFAQLSLRKLTQGDALYNNITIIEKETKRCKTIIENLLRFARQEKVAFTPTSVNGIVEDAVAIVDHQLGISQVKIEKQLQAGLPEVVGNGNQLQQVLMNLMINAQQAMGGKPGTVRVTTLAPDRGTIEIRIEDNGPGVPTDIKKKIFEPFFTTKPQGEGTGLGLSVSYGIIKDHGGDIRVEDAPEKGAAFIITLPARDASVAAV